ncbi:hypothetical protein EMPS_03828 [Entomortierella parvispora]|uniref:F-box domain-containing protein n=1 Tax=Entomortierella parvispora TaxID=205924 RepID=A0A9P3H7I9_9FUNG|nr:hypothetical protein EMPS_03828 [Entomortierella parvispora]
MHPLDIPEIALQVGLYFDSSSLLPCILVSRSWYQAFLPTLWKTISLPPTGQHRRPGPNVPMPWLSVLQRHGHLIHELSTIKLFPEETIRVLQVLELPNLQSVVLRINSQPEVGAHHQLKPFIRQHQGSLRNLTLIQDNLYGEFGHQDPRFRRVQLEPRLRTPNPEYSVWKLVWEGLGGNPSSINGEHTIQSDERGDLSGQRLRSLTVGGALVYWQEEFDACPGLWEFLKNLDSLTLWGLHLGTPDPVDEAVIPDVADTLSSTEPSLTSSASSLVSEPSLPFARMAGSRVRDLSLCEGDAGAVDIEVALIQQCTELRSLTWCNDSGQDTFQESFCLLLDRLAFLNSLDLGIPGMTESDCMLMLRSVRQPLRKLVLRESTRLSTRATCALLEEDDERHAATLEILHLPKSNEMTGLCTQMILSSCPKLQSFHVINGVQNRDITMDPREWACKDLRELELHLDSKLNSLSQDIIKELYSVDDFMRSTSLTNTTSGHVTVRTRKSAEQFNLMFERMKALDNLQSLAIHGRQCTRFKEATVVDGQVHLQWSKWTVDLMSSDTQKW